MHLLVFDVGGSHIAGALCDCETLDLQSRASVAVDCNADETSFYTAVDQLSREILKQTDTEFSRIGGMSFAFPGPFDYAQGISRLTHKFASLHGKSLRSELAARCALEPRSIRFLNDADAFLLGELTRLPSAREGNTVGITLGTGVGSAFAVAGQIARNGCGIPPDGEIWNLPWESGIVEDAISTRGIQAEYESRTARRLPVREIANGCPADAHAVEVFENFGETLGNVLRVVMREFRPSTIIFGGAISRSAALFLPVTARQFGGSRTLQVSTLFEDAALYGAAAYWIYQEELARKES